MIRSEQRGKETLGLLISEFESPKRSRRLAFINNRQRQMQRWTSACHFAPSHALAASPLSGCVPGALAQRGLALGQDL